MSGILTLTSGVFGSSGGSGPTPPAVGDRGVWMGGTTSASTFTPTNTMQYVQIATTGNASDFGDLNVPQGFNSACASSTRGVSFGGTTAGSGINVMRYITIATTGDTFFFGNLGQNRTYGPWAFNNKTRGIFGQGTDSGGVTNAIDYITIASLGDSADFGDAIEPGYLCLAGFSNGTRGIGAVGYGFAGTPAPSTKLQYVTIATTGDATFFGDLSQSVCGYTSTGASNGTRGLIFEGNYTDGTNLTGATNVIQYVVIASLGNATNFGDLSSTGIGGSAVSNSVRAITSLGVSAFSGGTLLNSMEYVTIATTGNSTDFGDLLVAAYQGAACSNSNGGLS